MGAGAMGVPYSSAVATPQPQVAGSGSGPDRFSIGSPPARSGALTWTAIYFYVNAAIGVLVTITFAAATASSSAGAGNAIPLMFALGFVAPVVYGDYLAGKRLWKMDPRGRGLGMFMAGLGVLGALLQLAGGGTPLLFSGILAAVVFYYLWTTDDLSR